MVAWGQVNRQRLEETMYVALSVIFVGHGGTRRQGFKVIIRREGEKPQTIGTFMGRHKKPTQGIDH